MTLDLEFVRGQFPAFSEPSLQGQSFFGNAGGSYACGSVIDRLHRFYRERKVQPYSAYEASRLGGEEMDEAQNRLSAMLGVTPQELSFGPSTTQNTYVLAQAFASWMSPGEAIVVTNQDHEANSGPWRRLAERGIEIREWQVDPDTGHLEVAALAELLDESVRLVCFPHCSNIVGEINPVTEITAITHSAGAFTCVDGVSYAPHGFENIGQLGCDIYLFSAYKTYGPHQGIMVMNATLAQMLPNQGHWFNANYPVKRFTPAGPDHAQVAACAGMVDYMDALAGHHDVGSAQDVHDLMRVHEIKIAKPLLDWASARNDLRLIGPSDATKRAPTVTLDLGGPAAPVAERLVRHGIMAEAGDFYGSRPLEAMGVDLDNGVLRLSFVHYTAQSDIDKLLNTLEDVL